jgi:hypothetical protein
MIASCTFQPRASVPLGRIHWDIARQGYGVIDVVHDCGDDAHTLQFIDVKTGWSEGTRDFLVRGTHPISQFFHWWMENWRITRFTDCMVSCYGWTMTLMALR